MAIYWKVKGGDSSDPNTRVYETNAYLPYHINPSDVFGLLCIRPAVGGLSSIVSAGAVYNEILEQHRDLLGIYYRPFYYAHLGDELPGLSPIFSFTKASSHAGIFANISSLGMFKVPLTPFEVEALNVFDTLTHKPGMRLDMMLKPGDLIIANNYAVLHSRTEFKDHEDLAQRRKLLRLWLKMRNARSPAPVFQGVTVLEHWSTTPFKPTLMKNMARKLTGANLDDSDFYSEYCGQYMQLTLNRARVWLRVQRRRVMVVHWAGLRRSPDAQTGNMTFV